jgi:hypothetical protein
MASRPASSFPRGKSFAGYADEHITHYTEESLIEEMRGYGLRCVGLNRVYRAIVVGAFE